MLHTDITDISDRDEEFEYHESDDENLYDAIEILKERKGQYLIKWAGVDSNGDPWPDSWANKRDVTDDLVRAWKAVRTQKKREALQRRTNKKPNTAKTRTSTSKTSESSKTSSSRRAPRAGTSTRSSRSDATILAGQHNEGSDEEYESISKGDRKKRRRLSKTPVPASENAISLPTRPAKRPRIFSDMHEGEKSTGLASPPRSSSDEMESNVVSNGKGKAVDRLSESLPKQPRTPPKSNSKTSGAWRHLNGSVDPGNDNSSNNDNGKAKLPRPAPICPHSPEPMSQSQVLSPGAQARLDQFDRELASHTQPESTPKVPLFYPAPSEESDSVHPRSRSPSHSRHSKSRSRLPASPPQRLVSPSATDYNRSPAPPPANLRQTSSRRAVDDSYRVGDVPETQSSPESPPLAPVATPRNKKSLIEQMKPRSGHVPETQSLLEFPPLAPVAAPRNKKSLIEQMKPRSGHVPETQSLPEFPPLAPVATPPNKKSLIEQMKPRSGHASSTTRFAKTTAPTARPLAPIPMLTASQFAARVGEDPDVVEEEEDDELAEEEEEVGAEEAEQLMSSIEQFSSPVKGAARNGKRPEGRLEQQTRARQREAEDADDEEAHERLVLRGGQLADAARVKQRAQMAEYDIRPTRVALNRILKQKQLLNEGVSMSTTESDIPNPSPGNQQFDVEGLRQEEEESTQDVMAYQNSVDDVASAAGDDPEASSNRTGDHSEAESVTGDRSMGQETDPEKLYVDGAERVAWYEEHASQQRLAEDSANTSQLGELMYLPDEEDPPPESSPQEDLGGHSNCGIEAASEKNPISPSAEPVPIVPPATNGRSRSASAGAGDDINLVLPPTASTRQNTPEPKSALGEAEVAPDRHLDAAMSLLNLKSDENRRLEALLADERAMLVAERAKNAVLEDKLRSAETRALVSNTDGALANANHLKVAEELLAAERASLATALQSNAALEARCDAAKRSLAMAEQQVETFREYYMQASQFAEEKGSENKELVKRVQIAEEATREGVAMIKATFELREDALKSEARDWRNQAVFLREQAVRTNDDDIRERAAKYPELSDEYAKLSDENSQLERDNENLRGRIIHLEEEILVRQDENDRLEQRLTESTEELADLKVNKLVLSGDSQVFRCGWRTPANVACPVLCRTQEDLNFHASMHVT
ncbi:hypothetical protein GGX14DRAFT_431848, partial [Mycena pura]